MEDKKNKFEDDFRDILNKLKSAQKILSFDDFTNRKDKTDYFITTSRNNKIWIDCKEKNPYNLTNWSDFKNMGIEEEFACIEDELCIRRLFGLSCPFVFLIERNNYNNHYYIYDQLDLLCMPKIRNNRDLRCKDGIIRPKGKWLLDLHWAFKVDRIDKIYDIIIKKCINIIDLCGINGQNVLPCYGDYLGENINKGGITRELW